MQNDRGEQEANCTESTERNTRSNCFDRASGSAAQRVLALIDDLPDDGPLKVTLAVLSPVQDTRRIQIVDVGTATSSSLFLGSAECSLNGHRHIGGNPCNPLDEGGTHRLANDVREACSSFICVFDELAPEIEQACAFTFTQDLEPGLPTEPETQTQIDCFGYPIAGFERKIEFVFGDGQLELIWIRTGSGEEDRLRDMLTGQFGEGELLMDGMESFADRHVILRTDKPELLMASDAIFEAYFGN